MPRWNSIVHSRPRTSYSKLHLWQTIAQFLYSKHTQQQTAAIMPFCTAITMQYNSYAIRSHSVLTTNSTGRVHNVQFKFRAQHTSEIVSIACLHNCCSEILTYQLQLWIALPLKNSRSPATAMIDRE